MKKESCMINVLHLYKIYLLLEIPKQLFNLKIKKNLKNTSKYL